MQAPTHTDGYDLLHRAVRYLAGLDNDHAAARTVAAGD